MSVKNSTLSSYRERSTLRSAQWNACAGAPLLIFMALAVSLLTCDVALGQVNVYRSQKLVEEERFSVPRNGDAALTPDGDRLCVIHGIPSLTDLRGGLTLVDMTSNEVIETIRFAEEGWPGRVASSRDPDGTTRCYVTVTRQSGSVETQGSNRVEVVNVTGDEVLLEDPIGLENFQSSNFGPIGVASKPDGSRLYVADRGHARVHVVDLTSPQRPLLASIPSQGDAIGVAVTSDGSRVYAANRGQSTVICIDAAINELGGPACNNVGTIPISIGPSGSGTAITLSPDGSRAYAVYNFGKHCVSVIDTDPDSSTFNREIEVIPTTGKRLESAAVSSDGKSLFVASFSTNELLAIDTVSGEQLQRIPVGHGAFAVVFDQSERAVAYVSNVGSRTISIIGPGKGVYISPDEDSRKTDGIWDFEPDQENCGDPSIPAQPDPADVPPVVQQTAVNRVIFSRIDALDNIWDIRCFDPHPTTGQWQSCEFVLPADDESSGLLGMGKKLLFQLLDISEVRRHRVTIDSYNSGFRPQSAVVESEVKHTDGSTTIIPSSFEVRDDNEDGVAEGLRVNAAELVTTDLVDFMTFDSEQDGIVDYISTNLSLADSMLLLKGSRDGFLPLTDTNGDGVPDAPALDLDRDGEPDPEIPLFPFVAGPPNPQDGEQWLYFAQFGDGGEGGPANLFSQIILLNLDTEQPAAAKLILKNDDGDPLSVDLNGEQVNGELEFTVPAGGLRIFRTDGMGPLVVGSATVRSDRAIAGVIVFGGSAGLAGVGNSHVMSLGFIASMETNTALEISTGLAVMNLESHDVTVDLTLEDTNGNNLASGQLKLKGVGHRALFVTQVEWVEEPGVDLDFSNFRGLLKASADAKLAATVLQTHPGEYATLPVARAFVPSFSPGSSLITIPAGDGSLDQKLYFPQFADGGSEVVFTLSQILLFNLTDQTANAQVLLKNDQGNPLTVDLNGEVVAGEKSLQIPAGGLRILESDGKGDLVAGSATVSSDQALAGVIVFAGSTGVAGVGSSSPILRSFVAPMESRDSEQLSTGIAIMNLESEEVQLTISLRDEDNQVLATAELELPAMGHRALFLFQFDWTPEAGVTLDFSDFKGLLKVESTGKVAATVLQTRTGIFATQPVTPSLK